MENHQKEDAIIIGAGIAGLALGAVLGQKGIKPRVIEKNGFVGGYISAFKKAGFTFETTVHTFYEGDAAGIVSRYLKQVGLQKKIKVEALLPSDTLLFPDFKIDLKCSIPELVKDLSEIFPAESAAIAKYFDMLLEINQELIKVFNRRVLNSRHMNLDEYFEYEETTFKEDFFQAIEKTDGAKLATEVVDEMFTDQRLKALLLSLPPLPNSTLMAASSIWILNLHGLYRAEGGVQKFSNELHSLIKDFGGNVDVNTEIVQVLLNDAKDTVIGVETADGKKIYSDLVISAIDVHQLFSKMIDSPLAAPYQKKLQSEVLESNFVLYVGVDADLSDRGYKGQNIYCFDDYNVDDTFLSIEKGEVPEKIPILIATNGVVDKSFAPEGKTGLVVHSVLPFKFFSEMDRSSPEYAEVKERLTEKLMETVYRYMPEIKGKVIFTEAASPLTLQRYTGNEDGSLMGWAVTQENLLPPFNSYKTAIHGLYLTGQWVYPGGGIPLCMLSALEVLNIFKRENRLPVVSA